MKCKHDIENCAICHDAAGGIKPTSHGTCPSDFSVVKFRDLTEGDRFLFMDKLWTKTGYDTARKHSKESVDMGSKGYGYIADSICSFSTVDKVIFIPPNDKDHRTGEVHNEK